MFDCKVYTSFVEMVDLIVFAHKAGVDGVGVRRVNIGNIVFRGINPIKNIVTAPLPFLSTNLL
jgi:hypothetical protein